MTLKKIHSDQPENFEFSKENLEKVKIVIKKYPKDKKKSAVMPLLFLAQKQNNNWIPLSAIKYIAKYLEMPYITVYEVATFYSMYNLSPVGKYYVQVCTTTPCMIRGSGKLVDLCKKYIGEEKKVSKDNLSSWTEVECLGACVNAPMMQINDDYFEDLDENKTEEILKLIIKDEKPKPGFHGDRNNTSPESGRKTLLGVKNA